jgi:hypothetical protein
MRPRLLLLLLLTLGTAAALRASSHVRLMSTRTHASHRVARSPRADFEDIPKQAPQREHEALARMPLENSFKLLTAAGLMAVPYTPLAFYANDCHPGSGPAVGAAIHLVVLLFYLHIYEEAFLSAAHGTTARSQTLPTKLAMKLTSGFFFVCNWIYIDWAIQYVLNVPGLLHY